MYITLVLKLDKERFLGPSETHLNVKINLQYPFSQIIEHL